MLNARVILGFMLSGLALGSVAAGGHREASEARAALVVDYSEILPVPGNASFEAADGDRGRNERLTSCITRALRRGNVNVPLVTGAEFARIAFPEFAESEAAPHSAASLEVLVGNARFRERLTAAEIRYVVVVTGSNSVRETFHGTECWWIPYFFPSAASPTHGTVRFASWLRFTTSPSSSSVRSPCSSPASWACWT